MRVRYTHLHNIFFNIRKKPHIFSVFSSSRFLSVWRARTFPKCNPCIIIVDFSRTKKTYKTKDELLDIDDVLMEF